MGDGNVASSQFVDNRIERVPRNHTVRDLSAFRQSGGAAGEEQTDDIVFGDGIIGDRGSISAFERFCVRQTRGNAFAAEVHPDIDVRAEGGDFSDPGAEIVIEDHDARICLRNHAFDFARMAAPVEGDEDGAQFAASEKRIEDFDAIHGENAHAIAATNAEFIAEICGQSIGSAIHFAVRESARFTFGYVDDCERIGKIALAAFHPITNEHNETTRYVSSALSSSDRRWGLKPAWPFC